MRGSKEGNLRGRYGMPVDMIDGFAVHNILEAKRKAIAYHTEYAINHEQGHRLLEYIYDMSGIFYADIKDWLDEQGLPHKI